MSLCASVVLVVSGCSSNSVKPDPTATATPSTGASTTSATSTKAPTKAPTKTLSPTPAPATGTIAVPKVASDAQAAVNAYIGFLRAELYVGQDPGQIRRGTLDLYLGGKALKAVNAQLDAMGVAGTAFRGNPDDPRLKILKVTSSKLVLLTSCPLPAKTNPYHVIDVSTGKTVAPAKHSAPPPYLLTLNMFLNAKKHWVLIKFAQDTSTTCTA